MRKSVISILLVVALLLSVTYAGAENVSEMTTEDLLALREAINNELATRYEPPTFEDGLSIADIFPDKVIAQFVRDKLGLFSTKDQVTQEQLMKVDSIWITGSDQGVTSLEGIQYLLNLKYLYARHQESLHDIPDGIGNLTHLEEVDVGGSGIKSIPDSICNLTNLRELTLSSTDITSLPAEIGNLSSLEELDISRTKITELPASIYNLHLSEFRRDGLDID